MSNVIATYPTGTESASALVREKYVQSWAYADDAYVTSQEFLDKLLDVVRKFEAVDTEIEVDSVGLEPDIDLQKYLRSAPENPISKSDYNINIPTTALTYNEDNYISTLLTQFKDKLITIIRDGDTGLSATVTQAMYDLETEWNTQINNDTRDNIASGWAEKGWPLPGAGLFRATAQVDIDYQNKMLDKARAITVETKKIAIENTRAAWTEANQLEATLMDYAGKSWERKLQAAIETIKNGLLIVDAFLGILRVRADVYGTLINGYAAEGRAIESVGNVLVGVIRNKILYASEKVRASIESLRADIDQLKMKYGFSIEAVKGGSQVAAQLAASAMSAVAASAHISTTASQGVSASTSVSHSQADSKSL